MSKITITLNLQEEIAEGFLTNQRKHKKRIESFLTTEITELKLTPSHKKKIEKRLKEPSLKGNAKEIIKKLMKESSKLRTYP